MTNKPVTPIWTPLLALFSSRAFLLALGTALVDALIIADPSLAQFRGEFMNNVTVLIGIIVTKITVEDVNKVHSAAKVQVAAHAASATIAAAQIVANKAAAPISSPEGADGDTRPMPPVGGSTLH